MQTSSSTLLCFTASLLPSNPRESLAYSMGFHSGRRLRLHLPSAVAHTSQHNLYAAFLLEVDQARKRKDITTHSGVSQVSVPTHDTALLPPAQCRKGEMAATPARSGPGSRHKVAVQPCGPGHSHSPHLSLPLAGTARAALQESC